MHFRPNIHAGSASLRKKIDTLERRAHPAANEIGRAEQAAERPSAHPVHRGGLEINQHRSRHPFLVGNLVGGELTIKFSGAICLEGWHSGC
jgi:hypothetical protein